MLFGAQKEKRENTGVREANKEEPCGLFEESCMMNDIKLFKIECIYQRASFILFLPQTYIIAPACEICPAQSRRRWLDLTRLWLLDLAPHWRTLSRSILWLLDETFKVDNLTLEITDSFFVLLVSSNLIAFQGKAHTSGNTFCDVCAMANRDATNSEDLLDLVGYVVFRYWGVSNILLEFFNCDELTVIFRCSLRLAVAHFICKIYSIQLFNGINEDMIIHSTILSITFSNFSISLISSLRKCLRLFALSSYRFTIASSYRILARYESLVALN